MGWGHYWTKAVLAVAWKIRTLNEQSSIKGGGGVEIFSHRLSRHNITNNFC